MSDTRQWLYRIQPVRPEMLSEGSTPGEDAITAQHFSYLQQLVEQGVVILAGRTLNSDNSSFGIIIFNAESEEKAREIVNNDPGVNSRQFRAELFPYRIALVEQGNIHE